MEGINPSFKKQDFQQFSLEECLAGIGSRKEILSYLISKAESERKEDVSLVAAVLNAGSNKTSSRRIAITGAPGVGKSTLINSFSAYVSSLENEKIAILPIDPSSRVSKGSLLGDRTRMVDLIGAGDNVYIKPTASSLALGGVAPSTKIAINLCEMAGYELIIIETVGVGQSEYEVKDLVDMMVLLQQPAGGDELQGIKRGIMELADLVVINKADGELESAAELSVKHHRNALQLFPAGENEWRPAVMKYSSEEKHSPERLLGKINNYFAAKEDIAVLRKAQDEIYFQSSAERLLLQSIFLNPEIKQLFNILKKQVRSGDVNPLVALMELEKGVNV